MSDSRKISRRRFFGESSCAAVSALPILSTMLNLRLASSVAAASTPPANEYRALVCVLLGGGNDSFNMLVPREASAYANYQASRSDLALSPEELIDIQPVGQPKFALHHGMPELAQLFGQGKAAFIANVGTLVEPVANRIQVRDNLKRMPLGLYSHSDQTEQWQTSVPHSRSGVGWAGRMAEILRDLNTNQTVPMNISLDGSNVWQTGINVAEYAIRPDGAVSLTGYDPDFKSGDSERFRQAVSAAVDSQLSLTYSNLLEQTLVRRKRAAVDAYALFSSATAAPLPAAAAFPDTSLGRQLQMVARTIQGRGGLGVSRQTFFIHWGGWDHHGDVLTHQEEMLPELSAALAAFYNALAVLGVENQVTLFTASDFGRTLTSNSRGSDHAWGGNQLVLGGAVKGQRIYGQYPSLTVNPDSGPEVNPLDTGRGRFIPTTSVDQFFAELALWLGVSRTDLPLILPNIGNFYGSSASAPPIGFLL
jgi:uncharacterized protein (DUF1501 family)